MFRPSASMMYSNAKSRVRTQEFPRVLPTIKGSTASTMPDRTKASIRLDWFCGMCVVLPESGAFGHAFAQQAGRTEHQHQDQHGEGENVLIVAAQEAAGEVAD